MEVEAEVLGREVRAKAGIFEGAVGAQRSANESFIVSWIVVGGLGMALSTLVLRGVC